MADKPADIPGKKAEATPVVFSRETMEQFADILAEKITGGVASGSLASSPSSSSRESRKRETAERIMSHAEERDSGLVIPVNASEESSKSSSVRSSRVSSILFNNRSPAELRDDFEKRNAVEGGLLPTYFGGKIGYQQIAQTTADLGLKLERNSSNSTLKNLGAGMFYAGDFVERNALAIESAKHFFSTARRKNQQLTDFGQRLGAQPGEGFGGQVGPVRLPFVNPSARRAISASFNSSVEGLLSPGFGRQEDLEMKANLADLGFYDGTKDAEALLGSGDFLSSKSGLRELMSIDPRLADEEMFTKALRYGSTSVEDMVKMMKEVPDAAKAANVGLEDMINQMKEAGDQALATGGTYQKGMDAARMFSATSGLPAEGFNQLNENPLIQGMVFAQTGLPSFMQGSLGPAAKNSATLSAVSSLIGTLPDSKGRMLADGSYQSATEQDIAYLQQMTGIQDTGFLKKMLNPTFRKTFQAGLRVPDRAEDMMELKASGNRNKAFKMSGSLSVLMDRAKDAQGNKIYTPEEADAVKNAAGAVGNIGFYKNGKANIDYLYQDPEVAGIKTPFGIGGDQLTDEGREFMEWMEDSGVTRKDGESDKDFLSRVTTQGRKKAFMVNKRKEKMGEIKSSVEERRKDDQEIKRSSNVTIDLTPEAKKYLRQVDPASIAKTAALGGFGSTVDNVTNAVGKLFD